MGLWIVHLAVWTGLLSKLQTRLAYLPMRCRRRYTDCVVQSPLVGHAFLWSNAELTGARLRASG